MIKNIGIVGAGYAGLTAARFLKAFGYKVMVFEKEADVGGVWSASRRYPGLTTQNPRDTYALSDFAMPRDYPEWPSGEQIQQYMQRYAEKYGFAEDILLDTEVIDARLNDAETTWTVDVVRNGGRADQEAMSFSFDYLIVANGIFSLPSIPSYPGVEEFVAHGGRICHTSEFTNPSDATDKHVLVVGYGKSSCDVANAIAPYSASTQLIARDLIWKIPKRLLNILNYKYLLLTRLGEGLFRYIRLRGFEKFLHGVGLPLRNAMLNTIQAIVTRQCRLKDVDLLPNKPLETIARSTVSLVTDGFYEKVGRGEIVVQKNTEITELSAVRAKLSNGAEVAADVVICGTGWQQVCSFLDDSIMDRVTDEQGNFRLYRSVLPIGVPRLAFNGYNSSFFSQLNAEIGALWLIDYLKGGIELPSTDEQNDYVDKRLAWMQERTDGKHSKGTNIIPFSVHHIDELLADMGFDNGSTDAPQRMVYAYRPIGLPTRLSWLDATTWSH